jgi:hypothetical protein
VLLTAGAVVAIGVGGGLIKPMQQRWERMLTAAERETSTQITAYQQGRTDAMSAPQQARQAETAQQATYTTGQGRSQGGSQGGSGTPGTQGPSAGYSEGPGSGYSQGPGSGYSQGPGSGYSQGPDSGYSQGPGSGYSQGSGSWGNPQGPGPDNPQGWSNPRGTDPGDWRDPGTQYR